MADIFAVRDLDKKTQEFIYDYAHEHELRVAQAIKEVVVLAKEHLEEKEHKKQKKDMLSLFGATKGKLGPWEEEDRLDVRE